MIDEAAPVPVVCLVTDRQRAAPSGTFAAQRACLEQQARHAADAGVDVLQVRERDLEAAQLVDLVASIVAAVRGSRTRVVVNERIDVAIAAGADGVHLRSDSVPVARARMLLARPRIVGRSVHTAAEAVASGDADYVTAGTVYATPSKPQTTATLLGIDGLRAIVRASPVPVLAIGGVTIARARDIATAGAAGVAAIGLFLAAAGQDCRARPLIDDVTELHHRFRGRP